MYIYSLCSDNIPDKILANLLFYILQVKHLISGNDIPVTSVSYREEFHFVDIALGEPTVPLQLYEIYIEFITPISGDSLNGMYQDFYEDNITGQTR